MRVEFPRLLPHEAWFGLFLVVMWARLLVAQGPFGVDALVFLAMIAINIWVIVAAERHPTRAAWYARLLFYAIAMNVLFQQLRTAIPAVQPAKADLALQEVDRLLIGGNLSVSLQPWVNPLATELLSLCYLLFFPYLLFSLVWYLFSGLALAKKFWVGLFTVYGIGFLGYSLVPAGGPYLAMAEDFTVPLTGWWVTQWNDVLVRLGSNGVDVFPSLHCAVSAYFIAFDFQHRRWRFWSYLAPAIGLWVSTIYLRYHYFIDVVAGFALAALAIAIANRTGRALAEGRSMSLVFDFKDPVAIQGDISGGKGANLALLTQRGFAVPPGFIISALAYREFIAASGRRLEAVERFSFDEPAALARQARELRERLAELPLPAEIEAQVQALLARFPADLAFSVRSSSTFEDLAGAAFAGQHDTFLNCRGAQRIVERVRDCFLSLWQDRAILYRHQRNFDQRAAAMAVVVQQMVNAEVAGVGFTVNPVNGRLDEMVINANYGLGESVVSGEGEIDQFVLAKADGAVRSSSIGRKSHRVVPAADGVKSEALDERVASQPCLSAATLRELAELMREVEKTYQFPQDVEWATAGGSLYLLQSRPVTAIPPRWTRDESAERFPNAITPLAWDFVEEGFHRSLNHSFHLMAFPPFNGKWFGVHGHYIYGNQNAVEIYGGRAPLAIRSVADLEEQLPKLAQQFAWVQELPLEWSRELDHYLLRIGEFMAEPLDNKTLQQVWAFVQEVNQLGTQYFLPNIAISLTQRSLYRVLHGLLALLLREPQAAARAFDALLAWCETKTGVINKELYQIASSVRADPELTKLLAQSDSRQLLEQGALAAHPAFWSRFQKFLRDHGHRETDFDPYVPTWVEAPWVVLDNLRMMVDLAEIPNPREKERELKIRMQQTEFELLSRIPPALHFFFNELLRLTRTYTSLDDLEHYQTTRLTLPLRKGLRELGYRLERRGVVREAMDVFFARLTALDAAIRNDKDEEWNALAKAIAQEKQGYLEHRASPPAWTLGEAAPRKAGAEGMTGLPGSPGTAEGAVYLVLSPDDFPKFPKGAVLVARTTNPAWTPLFYSACAVITESGGPLSHGAVTAREMQIPAVMSVHGVLQNLKNGQRVRVDGSAGTVIPLG